MTALETTQLISTTLTFWSHLSTTQQQLVKEHTTVNRYDKGALIHSADYQCIGMLIVKSGSLRVYMLSEDGREITLYRIHEGEVCILSASCVLKSITFDVYIDAVSDCELVNISTAAISLLMSDNIYAKAYAYQMATERFSDVMWAMQQILFMSFDRRLAIFLLDEAVSLNTNELKMTHEQIAKLMGSAREVVTRMLSYFSAEGYVELARGTVRLTDKKKLQELVGQS